MKKIFFSISDNLFFDDFFAQKVFFSCTNIFWKKNWNLNFSKTSKHFFIILFLNDRYLSHVSESSQIFTNFEKLTKLFKNYIFRKLENKIFFFDLLRDKRQFIRDKHDFFWLFSLSDIRDKKSGRFFEF